MEDNALQIFDSDKFGSLRVVMKDGEPWFIANDVCNALGIVNTADALADLDSDEKGVLSAISSKEENGGAYSYDSTYVPEMIETIDNTHCLNNFSYLRKDTRVVSESGLYALIFRSRKPEAKAFRKWVTNSTV